METKPRGDGVALFRAIGNLICMHHQLLSQHAQNRASFFFFSFQREEQGQLIAELKPKEPTLASISSQFLWINLQTRGLEKWNWEQALHVDLSTNDVIHKLRRISRAFPPVEPGTSPNFHRCHVACSVKYYLQRNKCRYAICKLLENKFNFSSTEEKLPRLVQTINHERIPSLCSHRISFPTFAAWDLHNRCLCMLVPIQPPLLGLAKQSPVLWWLLLFLPVECVGMHAISVHRM